MATLPISYLFFILLLLPLSTRSTSSVCEMRYCGTIERQLPIEFPFHLKDSINNEHNRCGYPGFEVLCNYKNQSLVTFPYAGDFVVTGISLENQRVWINDPDECLPRRFLQNINLTDSPFHFDKFGNFENIIFLNCTKSAAEFFDRLQLIPCLSNDEYAIIYYPLNLPPQRNLLLSCYEIGSASVPIKDNPQQQQQQKQQLRLLRDGLHSEIVLQWDTPNSRVCDLDQHCGFSNDVGFEVSFYDHEDYSFPYGQGGSDRATRVIKYLPIAWGVSVIIFLFSITISFVLRGTLHGLQRETSIESNIQPPPMPMAIVDGIVGIDRSTIEKYPKIKVGERGQLPQSIDNVCSICLSEYEPMETLRSMPQCNHYFHADCIDEWLKMNATCPLCRNSTDAASSNVVTSSSSSSSSRTIDDPSPTHIFDAV